MQIEGLLKEDSYVNSEKNFLISDHPDELLANFFSYLTIKELSSNVLVSKKFKQITVKTASSEQLIILKNLVKAFINRLNPDLYVKEIKELKIFCDNKYLSKSLNLIDLKNDLNDSYLILANILKDIPYADLKIEDIFTHEDLIHSQFFLQFVNTLSLLKLEKKALKEEDSLQKIELLKEVALEAVHGDFSDKLRFLKLMKNLAFAQAENSVAIGLKLGAHLSLASPLLAKSQFPIVEDLISKMPESFIKTCCETELKFYAPYWNKNSSDLMREMKNLLDVYNNVINQIDELEKTLINQNEKQKILAKFLKQLDLASDSTESINLTRLIAKFNSEPQVTEMLNKIVEVFLGYKKERIKAFKSLEIILSLLSARNHFDSVIEIIKNSSTCSRFDKLPWDNYILLNSPMTFSLDYLDKIPIKAAPGVLPRQRCFITLITRFVKQGYFKKALTLAGEYDHKYRGEMMVEMCKEIIEKHKNL